MNQTAQARIDNEDYLANVTATNSQKRHTHQNNTDIAHSTHGKGSITLNQNVKNGNMWKEFFTGMHMLHRYFSRTTADMSAIASANIRLLHNNLHATYSYKKTLDSARHNKDKQTMLANWPLINDSRLHSSIMSLQETGSGPLQHNLVTHICYDYFNTDGDLNTREPVSSFYLVISGKLSVTRPTPHRKPHSTNRLNHTAGETIYKTGDVLINPQHMGDISSIYATQKNTLLLSVHLAFS